MKKIMIYILLLIISLIDIQIFGQESDPNTPLFEIKNDLGQTVFAVYPGGVHIFVDDSKQKATGGGFKVGRIGTEKATGDDIFSVVPGEVNIFLDNTAKATGGGFKVGRIGTEKAAGDSVNYLMVTPDSTRIYTTETSDKGFAVGKLSTTETFQNFLQLTQQNYFIGHESGKYTTGTYNLFLGYRAGYNNIGGYSNYFAGYQSGFNNTSGFYNIFIGRETGFNNTVGQRNIFIGDRAGYSNVGNLTGDPPTIGHDNIYIGTFAGRDNADGEHNTLIGSYSGYTSNGTKNTFVGAFTGFDASGIANVFLGVDAGRNNTAGNNNTFLGTIAGNSNSGSNNTFVGYGAGYYNTTGSGNVFLGYTAGPNVTNLSNKLCIDNSATISPLIYGDFDLNQLAIYGNMGINRGAYSTVSFAVSPNGQSYGIYVDAGATSYAAYFNGNVFATGTISSSDSRFKTNISEIINPLEKLMKLRGVNFEWNTEKYPERGFEKGVQMGLIAQEVEEVVPELVKQDIEGYKAIAYDKLNALLIETVKVQQSEIESLKTEIEELKKITNMLTKEILDKNSSSNK